MPKTRKCTVATGKCYLIKLKTQQLHKHVAANLHPKRKRQDSARHFGAPRAVLKISSAAFNVIFLPTCRYRCMYHAAVFPSFTDSTVVLAVPATSPPKKTQDSLQPPVFGSTLGRPHEFSSTGAKASTTARTKLRFLTLCQKVICKLAICLQQKNGSSMKLNSSAGKEKHCVNVTINFFM